MHWKSVGLHLRKLLNQETYIELPNLTYNLFPYLKLVGKLSLTVTTLLEPLVSFYFVWDILRHTFYTEKYVHIGGPIIPTLNATALFSLYRIHCQN